MGAHEISDMLSVLLVLFLAAVVASKSYTDRLQGGCDAASVCRVERVRRNKSLGIP